MLWTRLLSVDHQPPAIGSEVPAVLPPARDRLWGRNPSCPLAWAGPAPRCRIAQPHQTIPV